MARSRHKGNRIGGAFLALPHEVITHSSFLRLSPRAKVLLIDIGVQYRGDNNGDLSCAWKLMKPRGWRSEETLNEAKKELLRAGFLFEARKGRRPNLCSLYALTWLNFDKSPKHDVGPAAFEKGAYRWRSDTPDPKGVVLTPLRVVAKAA